MSDSNPHLLPLPGEFVQPALSELKAQIDEKFVGGFYVQLDASEVERIDSAALQFLVAFANCDLAHVPCIENMGEPLVVALADIGVPTDDIEHLYGGSIASAEKAA